MANYCDVKLRDEGRTYPVEMDEIVNARDAESATYVEILNFLRGVFRIVDFSGIINESRGKLI